MKSVSHDESIRPAIVTFVCLATLVAAFSAPLMNPLPSFARSEQFNAMNTNAIVKKITKTVLGVTKSVLGTTSKATTTGGKKLVAGLALYKLTGDNANNPHCTGACAKDWPPLLFSGTGTPQAQGSIGNHTLGVVSNKNGK